MIVEVRTKGILCEQGGLVKIKGRLYVNTMSGFDNTLIKEWEVFSTFSEGLLHSALHGDERPITLADGDYLYYPTVFSVTLAAPWNRPPDYLKIGGYLITDFYDIDKYQYQVIKVEELNKDNFKTYWIRFDEGNRTVFAEFELKLIDDSHT
ncbi:hypothetical protein [Bacillus cereus]|uniref:hypothetical protein n=1 Tax=Bacillus cereus TaxID=1396 RepID=UPI000BF65ABE|nr:hypothetical protein [Bacillus cereus]PFC72632.1 hypothetical protein CN298_30250 [Bacillus cereus]